MRKITAPTSAAVLDAAPPARTPAPSPATPPLAIQNLSLEELHELKDKPEAAMKQEEIKAAIQSGSPFVDTPPLSRRSSCSSHAAMFTPGTLSEVASDCGSEAVSTDVQDDTDELSWEEVFLGTVRSFRRPIRGYPQYGVSVSVCEHPIVIIGSNCCSSQGLWFVRFCVLHTLKSYSYFEAKATARARPRVYIPVHPNEAGRDAGPKGGPLLRFTGKQPCKDMWLNSKVFSLPADVLEHDSTDSYSSYGKLDLESLDWIRKHLRC